MPDAASNATPPDTSAAPQYAPQLLSTVIEHISRVQALPACLCDFQGISWLILSSEFVALLQEARDDSWSHLGIPYCRYLQGLSDEERERRADGLFTEFLSSNDEKEALLCAHELAVRLHRDLEPAIMKLP